MKMIATDNHPISTIEDSDFINLTNMCQKFAMERHSVLPLASWDSAETQQLVIHTAIKPYSTCNYREPWNTRALVGEPTRWNSTLNILYSIVELLLKTTACHS